ncbi:MAG: DUF3400 domain-containing protein, partial [Burkholderiales bacterium]
YVQRANAGGIERVLV